MKKLAAFTFSVFVAMTLSAQAMTSKGLEKGEIDIQFVQKKPASYLKARGVFKAPVNKVWKTLTDFNHYSRYYESVVKSEVRAKKGNKYTVYVEFDFPWPINKIWVLNEYTLDPSKKQIKWKMLKGNLKNSDGSGSWKLKPFKKRTLATYRLNLEEGGMSQWVKKQVLYRNIPSVFGFLDKQMR